MATTLYINGRFLTQQKTGVQIFAQNLCLELLDNNVAFTILVPKNTTIGNRFNNTLAIGPFTGNLWEQITLPAYIRKLSGALLINLCNAAPWQNINQFITIHDLAFHVNPKWFSWSMRTWYNFLIPRIIHSSNHIFTVSHTVKKEIVATFNVSMNNISVLPNKPTNILDIKSRYPLPFSSFFLVVASQNPRKNIAMVEEAFKQLPHENLVIVGGKSGHFNSVTSHESANIHYTGYIDDAQINGLYSDCTAVISPSFYEGFGIPLLDAFKFKVPVLCADIPVYREVCDNAAMYFSPFSISELLTCIQTLPQHVDALINAGSHRYSYYTHMDRTIPFLNAVS